MNEWLQALWNEILFEQTLWVVGLLIIVHGLALVLLPEKRGRLKMTTLMVGLHVLLVVVASFVALADEELAVDVRLPSMWVGGSAGIGCMVIALFSIVLPRVKLETPRLLHDLIMILASGVVFFVVASKLGLNLSGLIATSAVLTAIVGFSMQDTLGNIVGGVAVQVDRAFEAGDWIRAGDVEGRVTEIRWRFTSVETRDWETVLVPNKQLLQDKVHVIGRREGQKPGRWRRRVPFNVDYRYDPNVVIEAVEHALRASPIPGVASDPEPRALMIDFGESFGRYEARYWLDDLEREDPTDSLVREHVYFGLKRAGMQPSIPAQMLFMTDELTWEGRKHDEHIETRIRLLRRLELFDSLDDEEREQVAEDLRPAPYLRDEIITRFEEEADSLFILVAGEVDVTVDKGGRTCRVATLRAPDYFGEMAMMTGGTRNATVTAATDVQCYRLPRGTFERLLKQRPALAELIAENLAARREELDAIEVGTAGLAKPGDTDRAFQLVSQIRSFFQLTPRIEDLDNEDG